MSIKLASPTEDTGSVLVDNDATEQGVSKEQPRDFLKVGRKNLNEDELASPAARRFMIAEIERLDAECVALRNMGEKFTELRVRYATLEATDRHHRWLEILSSASIAAGSAGLGAAPSYLAIDGVHGIGWTFVIGSGVLVGVGILSRVFR